MRFPSWLYKLQPNDEGSQQLAIIWRDGSSSSAATSVSNTTYTVPQDKCLVLTNVVASFDPGAAQFVTRRRIMADPPAGSTRYTIHEAETDGAADVTMSENWQGEVVIPGGWRVKVEGTFNAGAASNSVEGELHGYLIPRGTFIFG